MTEHVLHFSRVFDAPRELVFRCMVEPEHLTHFWGPVGTSTPLDSITVDARPGGTFATTMVNDSEGTGYPTLGLERVIALDPEVIVTPSIYVNRVVDLS